MINFLYNNNLYKDQLIRKIQIFMYHPDGVTHMDSFESVSLSIPFSDRSR